MLLIAAPCWADTTYTGTLVASPADGSGIWVNDPGGTPDWFPARIDWVVGRNDDGSWNYAYTIQVYQGEVSYFILETSEPLPEGQIFDVSGQFAALEIGEWFQPNPNNGNMPGAIYGIKLDDTWGTTFTVNLNSWRMPVWGDFYTKDGGAGKVGLNEFWNPGFLMADPLGPPANGSLDGHILRPDSYIPEPTTMTLMSLGLLGLAARLRRRKRSGSASAPEHSK